jgi:hypothetical protein
MPGLREAPVLRLAPCSDAISEFGYPSPLAPSLTRTHSIVSVVTPCSVRAVTHIGASGRLSGLPWLSG